MMRRDRTDRGTDLGEFEAISITNDGTLTLVCHRGICFTYATMFALEALSLVGENYTNSRSVREACDFLLQHRMDDGGWGETYMVRAEFPLQLAVKLTRACEP